MPFKYNDSTKTRARELWILGNHSLQAIAEDVGVRKAETVAAWAAEGGWDQLRSLVRMAADVESIGRHRSALREMDDAHDRIAAAIEALVARCLRGTDLKPADLRSLAMTIRATQEIRRIAKGAEASQPVMREADFTFL